MNLFIKAYCRVFQTVFRLALPILPCRDPQILPRIDDIPSLLKEQGRHRPLIVTDRGIHRLGLTRGLEASRLILENLEISYREASPEARKNMLLAAHKAGRAFSKAYVGYVHALAHALGGKYNTPHGLANAVILPIVLREYGSGAHRRLAELARYCRLAGGDASDAQCAQIFIDKIEAMNAGFGIPAHLSVIRDADIPELADHAYREANPLYPVPVLWDRRKLAEMYRRISG